VIVVIAVVDVGVAFAVWYLRNKTNVSLITGVRGSNT
jgi:hypothetical protein